MEPDLSTAGNIASIVSLLIVVIQVMTERGRKIIADGGLFKLGFGVLILIAITLNVTALYDRYAYRAAEQPNPQLVIPSSPSPPPVVPTTPAIQAPPAPAPTPAPAAEPQTPTGLEDLTNHALRLKAYDVSSRLWSLAVRYSSDKDQLYRKNIPADKSVAQQAELDEKLSGEFKNGYSKDVLILYQELRRRVGKDGPFGQIQYPAGILSGGQIAGYGDRLTDLANQLK
jgi:hypothetical protein